MSDFAWLEEIIAKRTPGNWQHESPREYSGGNAGRKNENLANIIGPDHWVPSYLDFPNLAPSPQYYAWEDARFIAAMGTLADKMMAVVKAVDRLGDCVCEFPDDIACCDEYFSSVDSALAALQAARKDVE